MIPYCFTQQYPPGGKPRSPVGPNDPAEGGSPNELLQLGLVKLNVLLRLKHSDD